MSTIVEHQKSRPPHKFNFEGTVLRTLDFTGVNLTSANLRQADARDTIFVRVNFAGAEMKGIDLRGADLTGAKNLTLDQLRSAVVDAATKLPGYIDRSALTTAPAEEPAPAAAD